MQQDEEFRKQLLATFEVEAKDHLHALSLGLIELEKGAPAVQQAALLENLFRAAHSLKGAARSVNLTQFERLCHAIEDAFATLKHDASPPTAELCDALHAAVDHLGAGLDALRAGGQEPSSDGPVKRIEKALASDAAPRETAVLEPSPPNHAEPVPRTAAALARPASDTMRVSATRLDMLLGEAEELLGAKLASKQRTAELRALVAEASAQTREAARKHSGDRMERAAFEYKLSSLAAAAERDQRALGVAVDILLHDMKRTLMLPFSSLLETFPKVVRDLAREEGKEIEVTIQGGHIEIDRRILDEMRDPLLHLIRNSVDHGLESPEERLRQGKPAKGTLTISVSQRNGNRVELTVADDGRGFDVDGLRAAAIRVGTVQGHAAENLSERELLDLAFQSGVSTTPLITELSGRGLGLAIVQERAERLAGMLSLDTELGQGTAIRIILPLTLATFRGVLVMAEKQTFVMPTHAIERIVRVEDGMIQSVENVETLVLDQAHTSLTRLRDVLELPVRGAAAEEPQAPYAVIAGSATRRMAFLVDEVIGEQEVLVKSLGKQLSRVRNVGGAAILGSGVVVPILNMADLLKSGIKHAGATVRPATNAAGATTQRTILVAEDSITARTLLKNILESAGFRVRTAVDGAEALALLRTEEVDLVVSDVDMPRMNGFDLATRLRADKHLAAIPLILVTALASREDRERGIEAGANAYIVKSSFDQSNLLEVISRFL